MSYHVITILFVIELFSRSLIAQGLSNVQLGVSSNINLISCQYQGRFDGLYIDGQISLQFKRHGVSTGINYRLQDFSTPPGGISGSFWYTFNSVTPIIAYSYDIVDRNDRVIIGGLKYQYFYTNISDCYTTKSPNPVTVCEEEPGVWRVHNLGLRSRISKRIHKRISINAEYTFGIFKNSIISKHEDPTDWPWIERTHQFSLGVSFLLTKPQVNVENYDTKN